MDERHLSLYFLSSKYYKTSLFYEGNTLIQSKMFQKYKNMIHPS